MQLSKDLSERFPDDRGYSGHNLRNMKKFASEYPAFPIWQVPLAKLEQVANSESLTCRIARAMGTDLCKYLLHKYPIIRPLL